MADKPVSKVQHGNISLSIWKNTKDDKSWLSYTFQRSYKDKDDNWQNTATMSNMADLARLKLCIDDAMRFKEE